MDKLRRLSMRRMKPGVPPPSSCSALPGLTATGLAIPPETKQGEPEPSPAADPATKEDRRGGTPISRKGRCSCVDPLCFAGRSQTASPELKSKHRLSLRKNARSGSSPAIPEVSLLSGQRDQSGGLLLFLCSTGHHLHPGPCRALLLHAQGAPPRCSVA
jgi:hypothetical protein